MVITYYYCIQVRSAPYWLDMLTMQRAILLQISLIGQDRPKVARKTAAKRNKEVK